MLLLLWKTPVGGDVEITIDSTLPAVQGLLDIDSGIPLQFDRGSWPQARIDIRIASILPVPTSRLVVGVHDDDLAVMILLEEVH